MENPVSVLKNWVRGESSVKEEAPPIISSRQQEPYADITIVLDKSGSMNGSIRDDIIGGFNEVVKNMRKDNPGLNRWTMVQFDTPHQAKDAKEAFPHVVFESVLENNIPPLTKENYAPRGGTALVDACYKTIKSVEARTSGQDHIKPVFMIMTDGAENASVEYNGQQLKDLIKEKTDIGWQFSYFGANQDSFANARATGINPNISGGGFGLAAGSSYANNWGSSVASGAIASGMIGCFSYGSGAIASHISRP